MLTAKEQAETLFLTFDPKPERPSFGWARMTREHPDGYGPHVLSPWQAMTRAQAKAMAEREGATFREA